jgi:hypothetical protein
MMLEIMIGVNLVVSIIGGGILVKWLVRHIRALEGTVKALEGTVKAQAETITTIKHVNETVVNVFTALDPERFLREVNVHKELADRKAAAIVEDAERKFRDERTAFSSVAVEMMQRMAEDYGEALSLALRFMPWVSKSHRALVIAETKLPDRVKASITEMAAQAPEWSAGGPRGLGLLLESGGVILREEEK